MMLSKNAFVMAVAVYGCPNGMKWPYLENRSMTVKMTNLSLTRRNPSTKFMVTSAHRLDGMLSGWSKSAGWRCSDLLRWQVVHADMKSCATCWASGMRK
jgi:hypothetical protein